MLCLPSWLRTRLQYTLLQWLGDGCLDDPTFLFIFFCSTNSCLKAGFVLGLVLCRCCCQCLYAHCLTGTSAWVISKHLLVPDRRGAFVDRTELVKTCTQNDLICLPRRMHLLHHIHGSSVYDRHNGLPQRALAGCTLMHLIYLKINQWWFCYRSSLQWLVLWLQKITTSSPFLSCQRAL